VTRILKEYGDALERAQAAAHAPNEAARDAGPQLRVLRCVLLLIELTGVCTCLLFMPHAFLLGLLAAILLPLLPWQCNNFPTPCKSGI
jgi:hypothetical protein